MDTSQNPPPLSRGKQLLFVLTVVVGLPVALLASIELGGRVYFHFKYGLPGKSYGIYMSDPELGATQRPSSYNKNSSINNWGFRNVDDISAGKPAGSTRVYCSGGSTTFCYNLPTEQAWPTRLQDTLRGRPGHDKDEVINAGQICFPVASELTLARRMIPQLKPDVVVIFTAVNEQLGAGVISGADGKNFDELLRAQQWGVVPQHLDQARFLKRESLFVRWLDLKFKERYEARLTQDFRAEDAKPKPAHPWVLANFEHTLRDYIDFLRKNGVSRVIVVRWGDNGTNSWFMQESRGIRDRGVQIAREMGAEVFDFSVVAEAHPRRKELFIESGIHLTREGADLFAEKLGAFIAAGPAAQAPTAAKVDAPN